MKGVIKMEKLTTEELKDLEKWEAEEKTVTLTKGQWNRLTSYLLMSTNYRNEEAKAWAKLAQEKDEDGKPKYKNAESNARFWEETKAIIEFIRKKIDKV